MNHSVHNGDVCIQLYGGICRPFIISGQSLQKHSRTNIPPSLPLLLQFHLSLRFTSPTDPSLPSLLPTFPPFPPHRPKPPPSSVSSLNPTYCLSQGGKHNHLFICFSLPFLRRLFIPVNTELPAGNKCKATRCQTEKSKSFTSCCFSLQSFHSFSSLFLSLPVLPNVCVLHNSH